MADLHRFQTAYKNSLERMLRSALPQEDKEGLQQFLRDMKARGIGYARLIKLCDTLTRIGKKLGASFEKATEEDIKRFVHDSEVSDFSFWTKHDLKCILKQYCGWLNKGKYPARVEWICTSIAAKDKPMLYQGDLLTQDEINRVLDYADSPRNKAILALLIESGARVGEIGNLTFNQVDIDPNGVVINVNGKTGPRRLRLVSATTHLVSWMNCHPDKQNPKANLWINMAAHGYHDSMTYEGIRRIIQHAFKRAGIQKRCNPYIFRHTRACQLAQHLTEYQMCAYFGWVYGSDMPRYYIRITGKDLDCQILKIHGLDQKETNIFAKPQDRVCPRCSTNNTPTSLYCSKCAEIVDPSLALKTQMETVEKPVERIKTPFLEWMQTDPELRAVLKRKAAEFRTISPIG